MRGNLWRHDAVRAAIERPARADAAHGPPALQVFRGFLEPGAFAAVQIARMTGDRSRDLPLEIRMRVVSRLEAANAPRSWIDMVRETVELDEADEGRVFGESLPAGLTLIVG